MAVRLSLGASRAQLIGQLLVESCLLALLGGAAGLLVSRWTLDAIGSMLPPEAVTSVRMDLDATVLMFAGALSLATGLLFGLFPALHSTRPDLVSTLKNQAGQPSGARAAARFRTLLATAQIALSMALLVSAGLFIQSLSTSAASIWPPAGSSRDVQRDTGADGTARALATALRTARGRWRCCRAPVGHRGSCSALAGSNTTNNVSVQDFPAGPTPTPMRT
jgi:ABC-type antimicrobial peptide transport system permease subunit